MDLVDIKRCLRAEIKKRENEQYFTFQCNVRQMCKDVLAKLEEQEDSIAELKQKLESVQATAYAESVDAGMRERKLKRALWLARANDASSFASLFSTLSDIEDDDSRTYWIFGNKRKIVIDGLKCHRMETSYKWLCIWYDVADRCLKKAKEYK